MRGRSTAREYGAVLFFLCVTGLAWANAGLGGVPEPWATRLWLGPLLAAGLSAGARSLGALSTLGVAAIAAGSGMTLEALAIARGGFEHRFEGGNWWAGVGWAAYELPVLLFVSRGAPQSFSGRVGAAALASLALGAISDPVGLAAGRWTWPGGGTYARGIVGFDGSFGVPLTNFVAWVGVGALAAVVSHVRAVQSPPRDSAVLFYALLVLLLLQALALGLVLPAALGACAAGLSVLVARLAPATGGRQRAAAGLPEPAGSGSAPRRRA